MNATITLSRPASASAGSWSHEDADIIGGRLLSAVELAQLDRAMGDFDGAERRLLEAIVEARVAVAATGSLAGLVEALGETYAAVGRLDDAERCYQEAYELVQVATPRKAADLAKLFNNLVRLASTRRELATHGHS